MARRLVPSTAGLLWLVLLLPVFLLAAVLLVLMSTIRIIANLLEPRFVPWTELVAFDQHLGWKPRPNLNTHYLAENDDIFKIVTDHEGWPGDQSIDQSTTLVIGDSFAFGYGIDTDKSFTQIDGLPIKAVGAPGYSMVHGVSLMEQFGHRLSHKLVVWLVFLENDLQDNLLPELRGYRMPFVRRQSTEWTIERSHIRPDRWKCSNLDVRRLFPTFCAPGDAADRAYSACDFLIGRAHAACGRVDARLVLVTVPYAMQLSEGGLVQLAASSGNPSQFDPDLPDLRIADCCERHDVPMVAAKAFLSRGDYKTREGIHWNARGHKRMARILRELHHSHRKDALEHCSVLTQRRSATDPCESGHVRGKRRNLPTAHGAVGGDRALG